MQVTIVNSCPDSIQVIYGSGEQKVNAFLSGIERKCFLSYLNEKDRGNLTRGGQVRTYSEQFKWLPVDNYSLPFAHPKYSGVPIFGNSDVDEYTLAIGNGGAS